MEVFRLVDKKVRNLVYTVNPLPYSLLNYIFDFVKLFDENVQKYIKNIVSKTIMEKK